MFHMSVQHSPLLHRFMAIVLYFVVPRKTSPRLHSYYTYLCRYHCQYRTQPPENPASPLIGLWIGIVVFAGVFGWRVLH